MTQHSSNQSRKVERGFRVEAPREGDAIGHALRDAYERDMGLPEDMLAMLRKLPTAANP